MPIHLPLGVKVITRTRRSCIRKAASITYPVGCKVAPLLHCGPLCLFSGKQAAYDFVNITFRYDLGMREGDLLVVPCTYTPSHSNAVWGRNGFYVLLQSLPVGTVLAKSLTCLE